jgi:hypothetical protein
MSSDDYDFRYDCGYIKPTSTLTISNRDEMVCSLALHYKVYARKAELDQIVEGLNFGGMIWSEDEAGSLKCLFCEEKPPSKLTASQVSVLFPPTFSEEGCNCREAEEEMALHWGYFLRDVEQGLCSITKTSREDITLTLEDVLAFATGATSIPILGFEEQGAIKFLHEGGMFPTASTCALVIRLPIIEDYETFKERMTFGILNAHGFFGNV